MADAQGGHLQDNTLMLLVSHRLKQRVFFRAHDRHVLFCQMRRDCSQASRIVAANSVRGAHNGTLNHAGAGGQRACAAVQAIQQLDVLTQGRSGGPERHF